MLYYRQLITLTTSGVKLCTPEVSTRDTYEIATGQLFGSCGETEGRSPAEYYQKVPRVAIGCQ